MTSEPWRPHSIHEFVSRVRFTIIDPLQTPFGTNCAQITAYLPLDFKLDCVDFIFPHFKLIFFSLIIDNSIDEPFMKGLMRQSKCSQTSWIIH